jgi:RND family efflux transporter MFP subunit
VVTNNITNGELRDDQKKVSQNSISAAQLQIDQLQESLDTYTITAPISGVIETANLKEHDYATSSSYAFVISNKDTMIATYYVSEDVRNTFTVGQTITLEKDDKTYQGEVVEIGSALDQTTGLFKIKAAVTGDTSGLLSGTKATVITDTYHEDNAVIIPYDSVYYDGSQAYVYTVVDGKAKRTNITTGLYDNDNIVVTEGLTASDTVITTWAAQLRDGVEVEIKNTQE